MKTKHALLRILREQCQYEGDGSMKSVIDFLDGVDLTIGKKKIDARYVEKLWTGKTVHIMAVGTEGEDIDPSVGTMGGDTDTDSNADSDIEGASKAPPCDDNQDDDEDMKSLARIMLDAIRKQAPGKALGIGKVSTRIEDDPRLGYKNLGEYAMDVRRQVVNGNPSAKLARSQAIATKGAASTFGSEGIGADGGFAVPPDFRDQITSAVFSEESLMSRAFEIPTSTNLLTIPTDEVPVWDTTNGVQAKRTAEGAAVTQTKPKLSQGDIKVNDVLALTPVSNNLLEDSNALSAWLMAKAAANIRYVADEQLIRGSGAGEAVGILTSGAKVTVAKETGQTADTIVYNNVAKMYSRMPFLDSAVWLASHDSLPQLMTLSIPVGTGGVAVWQPPTGAAGAPNGTIFGLPLIVTQHANTVGDEGDLILWSPQQYIVARRGELQAATSIHLFFDANTTAFRWVLRFGGQPLLSAPLTPRSGSNTLSSIVTTAARA